MLQREYQNDPTLTATGTEIKSMEAKGFGNPPPAQDSIMANIANALKLPTTPDAPTPTEQKPMTAKAGLIAAYSPNITQVDTNLAKGVASLADTLYSVVPATLGGATYALGRAVAASPQDAQAAADKVSATFDKPLGRMFGITSDPAYQNEALGQAMGWVGGKKGQFDQAIADKSGLSVQDVSNMTNTASYLLPGLVKEGVKPVVNAAKDINTQFQNLKAEIPANAPPAQNSFGAAGATLTEQAKAAGVPDTVVNEIATAEKNGTINQKAAQRHIEATSLPIPVALTAGQATGDLHLISQEQNMRGKMPELANRFNAQNGTLVQNINAIRDNAAPDVYAVNHVENGQALIDSYKAKDAALSSDISAKYKALEAANGGNFPIDTEAFVNNADAALARKMKGRYVPPEIAADLADFRESGTMTLENFENLRTNLAAEARKAERNGDGNRAIAVGLVRDALENMPISGEAANIKPLADAARSAAKARFYLLKADPAYKAAVNDTVAPDDFINKFVITGKVGNVQTMRANLANDPLASQTIASGTINFLKNRAGIAGDNGTFSQSGYNRALQAVGPKLNDLVPPEQSRQLQTLGNVARYTQEQPKGAYVNNANTFVAAAGNAAKSAAEGGVNVAMKGIPVGSWIRGKLENRAAAKQVNKSLQPAAGVRLSDFPR